MGICVTRDPQRKCEIGIEVSYIIEESRVPGSRRTPERKKSSERLNISSVIVMMIGLVVF